MTRTPRLLDLINASVPTDQAGIESACVVIVQRIRFLHLTSTEPSYLLAHRKINQLLDARDAVLAESIGAA